MLLATIDISWKAQDIVNVFIEVVTLIVTQNPKFFIITGIIIVVGAFLLIFFGVCCGMCCYSCTKRQTKKCSFLFSAGLCCEENEFDIEKGRRYDQFEQKKYSVQNTDVRNIPHSITYGSSQYFDGKIKQVDPV